MSTSQRSVVPEPTGVIAPARAPASHAAGAGTPDHTPGADPSPAPSERSHIHQAILRTLLYYDIWEHPLTAAELALFLPVRISERSELEKGIREAVAAGTIAAAGGYVFPSHRTLAVVAGRTAREQSARRYWPVARFFMHVIKRAPFVRAVMVSGELSKNVWSSGGDIDYFILTEPRRLWLTRTMLVLFKKIFLLNRKKFFCLNYFATTTALEEPDRNAYVAAEVAHVKPLYHSPLYRRYLEANSWISAFFPNFIPQALPAPPVNERRSLLQQLLETFLSLLPLDRMDRRLERFWTRTWARRYSHLSNETRLRNFTSTDTVSRAYAGDFQGRILAEYRQRLDHYGLH